MNIAPTDLRALADALEFKQSYKPVHVHIGNVGGTIEVANHTDGTLLLEALAKAGVSAHYRYGVDTYDNACSIVRERYFLHSCRPVTISAVNETRGGEKGTVVCVRKEAGRVVVIVRLANGDQIAFNPDHIIVSPQPAR